MEFSIWKIDSINVYLINSIHQVLRQMDLIQLHNGNFEIALENDIRDIETIGRYMQTVQYNRQCSMVSHSEKGLSTENSEWQTY